MRKIIHDQVKIGEIDISDVFIELDSRDEMPQILRGLRYIWRTPELRDRIFELLWELIPEGIDKNNGRDGMSLWRILVLGTIRTNCNIDYDKLQDIANNHLTLRKILGHSIFDEDRYPRQTLNDNLRWFTKDILDRINQIVVQDGLGLLGKDSEAALHGRCDSFVVETDVHYPTDINLLWDSIRKVLTLTHRISEHLNFSGFRQTGHNLKKIKRLFRKVQKLRTKDKKSKKCLHTTDEYITLVESFLIQSRAALDPFINDEHWCISIAEIIHYIDHGHRQIDQIRRRCFNNETIPHNEKVFSLFEDHTEYIKKGKAGVPQELGLRVCVMNSPEGFILHHHVMVQETDDKVAIKMVKETQEKFNLKSCSFDKGFHSPSNQRELRKLLSFCVLPKKGKLSRQESVRENTEEFKTKRRHHSAVESSINA